MAWGFWNKIKNGFKKAFNWVKDKIIKPVANVVKGAWNKVVKPVANVVSNIPGIEKLPGPAGAIAKGLKIAGKVSPIVDTFIGNKK